MRTFCDISISDVVYALHYFKDTLDENVDDILEILGFNKTELTHKDKKEPDSNKTIGTSRPNLTNIIQNAQNINELERTVPSIYYKDNNEQVSQEVHSVSDGGHVSKISDRKNSRDFLKPVFKKRLIKNYSEKVNKNMSTLPRPDFGKNYCNPPFLIPLFNKKYSRSMLIASASVKKQGKKLNLDKMTYRAAKGKPIEKIEYLLEIDVADKVQLLINNGKGMEPFYRDCIEFENEMKRVLGTEVLEVKYFINCALSGCGSSTIDKWKPYSPPPTGTLIIILTDLGLAPTEESQYTFSVEEWKRFLLKTQMNRCFVTALVPYSIKKRLRLFKNIMRIVLWDQSTKLKNIIPL